MRTETPPSSRECLRSREVVVVGAGISGLYLAKLIAEADDSCFVQVLEAQAHVGGRTLGAAAAPGVDLGGRWIWPHYNRAAAHLVGELGLGLVREPDGSVHLKDSAGSIAAALHEQLKARDNVVVRLEAPVRALTQTKAGIAVDYGTMHRSTKADTVFIACPPRLTLKTIAFEPALDEGLRQYMASCRTWMAQQAKFVATYETQFWSTHMFWETPRSVGPLETIFDGGTAIWGFLKNEARWRDLPEPKRRVLALRQLSEHLESDAALHPISVEERDWAKLPWICSEDDAAEPHPWRHPSYPQQDIWEQPQWGGRLWFVGSETAKGESAGFIDGAAEAALARARAWERTKTIAEQETGKGRASPIQHVRQAFHRREDSRQDQ